MQVPMRMTLPVSMIMPMGLIGTDFLPTECTSGRSKEEIVSDFLSGEIEKAGGKAVVEVTSEVAAAWWATPPADGDSLSSARILYVAHMMQCGLLADPSRAIADTAYAGQGGVLSQVLLLINHYGLNRGLAERDASILVKCAPMFSSGWLCLALIQIENGALGEAAENLERLLSFEPGDWMAMKFLAIALMGTSRKVEAMVASERMIRTMSSSDKPVDQHARLTHGFALLAGGLRSEAKVAFRMAGVDFPVMTPRQWGNWGHMLVGQEMVDRLASPVEPGRKIG